VCVLVPDLQAIAHRFDRVPKVGTQTEWLIGSNPERLRLGYASGFTTLFKHCLEDSVEISAHAHLYAMHEVDFKVGISGQYAAN
jgi:hypothetical protein